VFPDTNTSHFLILIHALNDIPAAHSANENYKRKSKRYLSWKNTVQKDVFQVENVPYLCGKMHLSR